MAEAPAPEVEDFPIGTRVFWPLSDPSCWGIVVGSETGFYRLHADCRTQGPHSHGETTLGMLIRVPRAEVALDRRRRL